MKENTESPSDVRLCAIKVSTPQWLSTQITLFSQKYIGTRNAALWPQQLTMRESIDVYQNKSF